MAEKDIESIVGDSAFKKDDVQERMDGSAFENTIGIKDLQARIDENELISRQQSVTEAKRFQKSSPTTCI